MKSFLISFYLLLSGIAMAQFGFERVDSIKVYKSAIQQKFPWAGGLDYAQFSNIDLNFDGVKDLFIFDRTTDKVLTFIQKGSYGVMDWEYAPEYEENFPEMSSFALLVDYDCDGLEDIFTYAIGTIKVYKNISNSTDGIQFELFKNKLTWYSATSTYPPAIYNSSIDIPAVADIDSDGDVDILNFYVSGTTVRYYRNMSMEYYGICDSLEFNLGNKCWGLFYESTTDNTLTLNQVCSDQVDDPYMVTHDNIAVDRHSGSTVLALDVNADNVSDLILGDISFNTLSMLTNGGTAPNTNSEMNSQDNNYPSDDTPVDLAVFPAAYFVDINNDNIRDLVVAPASTADSENKQSTWYYQNNGADNLPDFNYVQNDLFQDQMIEVGTSAYPVFFDHNGDGLMDLIVSTLGVYNPVSLTYESQMTYYQNTGTLSHPEFTFVTDDYLNIKANGGIGTKLNYYPTFGDIDGDGDQDMVIGEYSSYLYLYENTAGAGNTAAFTFVDTLRMNDGSPISETNYPFPQLIDIDRDGDQDLVLGKRTGYLSYYKNIGDANTFEFKLWNEELGGVYVTETGYSEGRAIPVFIDIDGEYQLVVGSKMGALFHYSDIESNLDSTDFTLLSNHADNIYIGDLSCPAIYDLTNNNHLEMVLGNARGGVAYYVSASVSEVGVEDHTLSLVSTLKVYPNPSESSVTIEVDATFLNNGTTQLYCYDMSGRLIYNQAVNSEKTNLDLTDLTNGVYLIQMSNEQQTLSTRFIKR